MPSCTTRSPRWSARASTTCSRCAATRPRARRCGRKTDGGLEYSRELVELISAGYPFAIGAACFPETHIHAESPEADLEHLAEKVDAGVDFLITQLFFDNAVYFAFSSARARPGITCRSSPASCRSRAPARSSGWPSCAARRSRRACNVSSTLRGEDPEGVLDFGVAYATLQCAELLAAGAPGNPLLHAQPLPRRARDRLKRGLKLARAVGTTGPRAGARLRGAGRAAPRAQASRADRAPVLESAPVAHQPASASTACR